jgi:uncharacterized protein
MPVDGFGAVRSPLRLFWVLAFACSWGFGGLGLLVGAIWPGTNGLSTSSPLYYAAAYSISIVGIALTYRYDGRAGLKRLAGRLAPWRTSPALYLLVIGGYAAITAAALIASSIQHSTAVTLPDKRALVAALAVTLLRDPGPLGEEFGWRGFALPRLLEAHSQLKATLILGAIHAAWHLPLFLIPGMPQAAISLPLFVLGVVSIAVIDTALYLRARANLLFAVLVHVLANFGGAVAADAHALSAFFIGEGIAAALVLAAGGLTRPPGSRPL